MRIKEYSRSIVYKDLDLVVRFHYVPEEAQTWENPSSPEEWDISSIKIKDSETDIGPLFSDDMIDEVIDLLREAEL